MTDFPGSEHDVTISHGLFIDEKLRGRGIAQVLMKRRIEIAREMNKSLLTCIVNDDNQPEIHILEKFGWTCVHRFFSQCSCHTLRMYVRDPNSQNGMI